MTRVLALVLLLAIGCRTQDDGASGTPESTASPARTPKPQGPAAGPPRLLHTEQGEVATIVRERLRESGRAHRKVVVYVGATWCEPCKTFHDALSRGALDEALAGVDFLEFDVDRDRERLITAGYASKYIPLFAKPTDDGRASGTFIEGSIKGEGAPKDILSRLAPVLR